jgi:tetratricopeptide (TPR) repeat protein
MELPDTPRTPTAAGPGELQDRLEVLVQGSRWREAVDVLKALASGESGMLCGKYLATAAKIVQNKLGQEAEAAELYNRALAAFPDDPDTFDRLYQIFAARRAWPQLERSLRQMIARIEAADLPQKQPALESLWQKLGDVYRMGLQNLDAAAQAYEVCARLAPRDPRYPVLLAELGRLRSAAR